MDQRTARVPELARGAGMAEAGLFDNRVSPSYSLYGRDSLAGMV
jgi:hypothetical protein